MGQPQSSAVVEHPHGGDGLMATRQQIYERLATVYDTCSVFNGTNLNIVEMGLVERVEQDGGSVRVRLLLTDPICLYQFEIRAQIVEKLNALPGIDDVHVEPVAGKLWWPERMAPEARERLEELRRTRFNSVGRTLPLVAAGARQGPQQ
jgi:metal-sulfur cluster biosynthetic enzyme